MAHPFQAHRQNKVEHQRVGHVTKGYASGGAVTADPSAPKRASGGAVKTRAPIIGRKNGGRLDRLPRKNGGRTNAKKGTTNVNVIIAPQGGEKGAPPIMPPPGVGAGPPTMAPKPPMMPPPGMAGGAPGLPPPGIRSSGGRAYASGGAVKSGPAWEEGKRNGTQVSHSGNKNDGKDIGRGKPVTYASGGAIEAPIKGGMGPKFSGGARGGLGRLEKAARAAATRE